MRKFKVKCKVFGIPFENEYGFFVQPISGNDANILFANVYGKTKKIAESNAKLIAAAPEMLELLIKISEGKEFILQRDVKELLNKIL